MNKWTADFTNNPFDDYNLMVELFFDEVEVASIKKGEKGLELKLYENNRDLCIPLNWLSDLILEFENKIIEES